MPVHRRRLAGELPAVWQWTADGQQGGGEVTTDVAAGASLSDLERVIERGLTTFVEVGQALLAIRDGRLYLDSYSDFDTYCRERWGWSRQYADKQIRAADVSRMLLDTGVPSSQLPTSEKQARALSPLRDDPDALRGAWQEAHERYDKPTAEDVREVVTEWREPATEPPAVHQLLTSSASVEWFTPGRYIEVVRELLGGIDLDPASCEQANRIVGAGRYFTEADDGFTKPWLARSVFLNPPYSRRDGESNQSLWSARLLFDYQQGNVKEAVLLVNAVPAERWWRPLWDFPVCFPDHRIRFYSPDGEPQSPTHSNAFVYLGPQIDRFIDLFSAVGVVVGRLVAGDVR